MQLQTLLLTICCLFTTQLAYAQPSNDNCLQAITLTNVSDYCSTNGEFNNIAATPSSTNLSCGMGVDNDVWFRFTATGSNLYLSIGGIIPNFSVGTIQEPQIGLYSGDCSALTEIQCAIDAFADGVHFQEMFATGLIPGDTYYFKVSAIDGKTGTFKLCVSNFNEIPSLSGDCSTGTILCDKSPFSVNALTGTGLMQDTLNSACVPFESASSWYKWTCKDSGTLTFALSPNNPADDLDFTLFELPNGAENCTSKNEIRCMASGRNGGCPFSNWAICHGVTGLKNGSTDIIEGAGCYRGESCENPNIEQGTPPQFDDNYIAPVNMISGVSYALLVNNFSETGNGFAISFGGTGTFLGPEPDFTIDPELGSQCDIDEITFTDNSTIPAGMIAEYEWSFGQGATPANANTVGPHNVTYESFGEKTILLKITTEEGCIVTEVRTIFIEACCMTPIEITEGELIDPLCSDTPTGSIGVNGSGGTPAYSYSLDGQNFQIGDMFNEVFEGLYTVYIQDIKGCIDSIDVALQDPPPLIVDAGPDQSILLGEETDLNADANSPNDGLMFEWTNTQTFTGCFDCLDPDIFPTMTTTYDLTAFDELGCSDQDSVTIFVEIVRPIYIPNAFSPNNDGANDNFSIYAGPAAANITELRIYNRWGGLVYDGRNLPIVAGEAKGWNGLIKGEKAGIGVYTYYANVLFIDGVSELFEGDVMLIR